MGQKISKREKISRALLFVGIVAVLLPYTAEELWQLILYYGSCVTLISLSAAINPWEDIGGKQNETDENHNRN
jgi:hypothetical protein